MLTSTQNLPRQSQPLRVAHRARPAGRGVRRGVRRGLSRGVRGWLSRWSCLLLWLAVLHSSRGASATPLEAAAQAFAREQFADVIKQLPSPQTEGEPSLLRARALLRLGRHAEAEPALKRLVSAIPELRDLVLVLHAEALAGLGRHAEAAAEYRAAGRSRGSRFIYLAFRRRARALLDGGRWREAAQELAHLLRTQPQANERPEWELSLALCEAKLGKRREAAARLRELWLTSPVTPEAARAREELDRLLADGRLRLPRLSVSRRLGRIQLLRREKLYDRTLDELKELRVGLRGEEAARVDLETAMTLIWANRPAAALAVLQQLPAKNGVLSGWRRRALTGACMARTGKVEEGAKLLLAQSYRKKGPLRAHERAEVARAALLLADHGRHAEALELRLRLAALARKMTPDTRRQLGWLSYRAGRYPEAIQHLEIWSKRARGEKGFALYWLARSHARAGDAAKAETLYREILEKHGQSYYGLVARSRLVEAGKLKLEARRCAPLPPVASAAARHAEVLDKLAPLLARHGEKLPELRRAHLLWRLGMIADARRELRLLAIRVAWVAARGRPRDWIQRPSVERLWRGGPLETRRWGKTERELAKQGPPLRHAVGAVLQAAGSRTSAGSSARPTPTPSADVTRAPIRSSSPPWRAASSSIPT